MKFSVGLPTGFEGLMLPIPLREAGKLREARPVDSRVCKVPVPLHVPKTDGPR